MVGRLLLVLLVLLAVASCKKERIVRKPDECPPPPVCSAPSPESSDSITLERTRCPPSMCRPYEVTLRADGTVTWRDMLRPDASPDTYVVPAEQVRDLFHRAASACFFSLKDEYFQWITDADGAMITIRTGGRSKRVHVYPGRRYSRAASCEPDLDALYDLGLRIDEVAGSFPKEG